MVSRDVPDELIEYVAVRLAEGAHKGVIKREISDILGITFDAHGYEGIFLRARVYIRGIANENIEELIQAQLVVYASIISDHESSNRDKLKAMELRENLLGMGARFGTLNPKQKVMDMKRALDELDAQTLQEPIPRQDVPDGKGDVP